MTLSQMKMTTTVTRPVLTLVPWASCQFKGLVQFVPKVPRQVQQLVMTAMVLACVFTDNLTAVNYAIVNTA
jgi:hypothetical protein